jgi:hypothetical protein
VRGIVRIPRGLPRTHIRVTPRDPDAPCVMCEQPPTTRARTHAAKQRTAAHMRLSCSAPDSRQPELNWALTCRRYSGWLPAVPPIWYGVLTPSYIR